MDVKNKVAVVTGAASRMGRGSGAWFGPGGRVTGRPG
jgi:NAD(P)-dependent dehydrogenase (short-subunit alcohol dehydrogenase family)